MSKNLLIAIGVGLVCAALGALGLVYMQRGAHLELPGTFLKVRLAPLDENSSVAMIDFRVTNTSDYPAVVRNVAVAAEEKNGNLLNGYVMADPDAKRVFDGLPILGQKYNPSLILRDQIRSRATLDRMIGARFDVPEARLLDRARLVITIEEIDGRFFEISEK